MRQTIGSNEAKDCSLLLSEVGSLDHADEMLERPILHPGQVQVLSGYTSCVDRRFSRQYCHSYAVRLMSFRPSLEKIVKKEWEPQKVSLKRIADLCEATKGTEHPVVKGIKSPTKKSPVKTDRHEQRVALQEDITVAIIGTIFKHQPEKPSILQELGEEDNPMIPLPPKQKYTSDKDYLLFEDETTRVRLVPTVGCGMTVDNVVNGVVCAVKGKPTLDGKFEVHETIWPTPAPCSWEAIPKKLDVEMVFVSGLLLGKPKTDDFFVDLLFEYLEGLVGSVEEQKSNISQRARVIFLGNSLWKPENSSSENLSPDVITNAKKLDSYLNELAKTMEVFIFPGKMDPAEPFLPQPPIHRCILPKSSGRKTFQSLSSPTRLKFGLCKSNENMKDGNKAQLDIIFNSGENVSDAMRNSDVENPVEMSKRLLEWGHICPTAPDTLPLHPGCQDDEFIIKDTLPHMFIVGNQKEFRIQDWQTTKIVTIPEFSESNSAIILTKDMEFIPMSFTFKK